MTNLSVACPMHDFQEEYQTVFHANLSLSFSSTKQFLSVISGMIKVFGSADYNAYLDLDYSG